VHTPKPIISAFLNIRGKKYKMCYLGVKHCEYLQNLLQSLRHTMVFKEI
jgi:hypothetical protein